MTPAIETRGLTKRYRRITALSDCSITVPEGRISALVGPNGAGKTTLLRLLVGLASPTSGEAAILGRAPRQDPAFLAEIGFLAQEIPLYRRMSAEAHIGIGAHLNPRWDGQSVRDRLRGLNIPLDAAVGTLSGGQRAQVALALTLAKRPRVLLLDEPSAGLAPRLVYELLATMRKLVDGGLSLLLVEQNVRATLELVDELYLLERGKVVSKGPAAAMKDDPRILEAYLGTLTA